MRDDTREESKRGRQGNIVKKRQRKAQNPKRGGAQVGRQVGRQCPKATKKGIETNKEEESKISLREQKPHKDLRPAF